MSSSKCSINLNQNGNSNRNFFMSGMNRPIDGSLRTDACLPIPRFLTSAPMMYQYSTTRTLPQYSSLPFNVTMGDLTSSLPKLLNFPLSYPGTLTGIPSPFPNPLTSATAAQHHLLHRPLYPGAPVVYCRFSSPGGVYPQLSSLASPKLTAAVLPPMMRRPMQELNGSIVCERVKEHIESIPSPGRATRPTSLEPLEKEQIDTSNFSVRSPKRQSLPLPRFTESPPPTASGKIKGELVGLRVAELEHHIRRISKATSNPRSN